MHFKKTVSRAIVLLCVLATLLSLMPFSASGISYDGSGTSGNGTANSSGNGTYGIYSTNLENELIGYRFTGVTAQGERPENTKSLDVILDDAYYVKTTSAAVVQNLKIQYPKYSKLEIHQAYNKFVASGANVSDISAFDDVSANSEALFQNPKRTVWASSLDCEDKTIPKNANKLREWQDKDENLDPIAKLVGFKGGIADMMPGDKIIAEPLFVVKLEGTNHAITPSELALYSALTLRFAGGDKIFSEHGDGTPYYGDGSPSFIRKFTNYYFPNAFYTPDGHGLWDSASYSGAITGNQSDFSNFPTVSYGQILKQGYGAVIMYTAQQPQKPDFYIEQIKFVDSEGKQYHPQNLPLNKTIYVVVRYNCRTPEAIDANLFFYKSNSVPDAPYYNLAPGTYGAYNAKWRVILRTYRQNGAYARIAEDFVDSGELGSKVYNKATMTPMSFQYTPNLTSREMCIMTLKESTPSTGGINAAIFKKGKTVADAADESNITNNKMQIQYAFNSETSRDLATIEIVLKNKEGIVYERPDAIPFGETVYVYHRYRSGSYGKRNNVTYTFDEINCVAYIAGNDKRFYRVSVNGNETFGVKHAINDSKATGDDYLYYVGSFEAGSLINQNRYGGISFADDYTLNNKNIPDNQKYPSEYNKSNNIASTTWRARCNVRLHQIILQDGNGNVYVRKTYGGSSNDINKPIPDGTKIYITYVYKNTSARVLAVSGNGFNGANISVEEYRNHDNTVLKAENGKMWVEAGKVIYVSGGSFVARTGNSHSTIDGRVDVYLKEYGLEGKIPDYYETDIMDNSWGVKYTVVESEVYDVAITQIQYVYKDSSGKTITKTVKAGDTNVVTLPRGAEVFVWYTFQNNGANTIKIDGYYAHNKTSGLTLMNGANEYNANGISIASKKAAQVCVGSFIAKSGSGYYYGAVYRDGYTTASGETNTTNNTMKANYKIDSANFDVGVKQVKYVYKDASDKDVTVIVPNGSDNRPAFPRGTTVKVYYTFYNTKSTGAYVDGYQTIWRSTQVFKDGKKLPTGRSAMASCTNYWLPANSEATFYVGEFTATTCGESKFIAEVYQHGMETAEGEANPNNNKQESKFLIYGDVGIDIWVTEMDGTPVTDPNNLWQLGEYQIRIGVYNNTDYPQAVDVYYCFDRNCFQLVLENFTLGPAGSNNSRHEFVVQTISPTVEGKTPWPTANLGRFGLEAEVYYTGTDETSECNKEGEAYWLDESTGKKCYYNSDNYCDTSFTVVAEVGIVDIVFNNNPTGTNSFREGTLVKVYYDCINLSPVDREVCLKYQTDYLFDADGNVITHIIPANTTADNPYRVYITEFIVQYDDGEIVYDGVGEIEAEIYRVGLDSEASKEVIPQNNYLFEEFTVYYTDLSITDIFYVDAEGNFYGYGDNNDVTLMVGEEYLVCYTVTNNSSNSMNVHLYDYLDNNCMLGKNYVIAIDANGNQTEFKTRSLAAGIVLKRGQSISIVARAMTPGEQEIGKRVVSGSVYINVTKNASKERNPDDNVLQENLILKHNVSIEDVYYAIVGSDTPLTVDNDGYAIAPIGTPLNTHIILKNHCGKSIDVTVYTSSLYTKEKVGGSFVITLAPYEEKHIVLDAEVTLNNSRKHSVLYAVYRDGCKPKADEFETTFDDNECTYFIKGILTPYLRPIAPNAPYREGTDVITSFYLYNPTNINYTGQDADSMIKVRFSVRCRRTGKVFYTEVQDTVIPKKCTKQNMAQLVFFKWKVPENVMFDEDKFIIEADILIQWFPGIGISPCSNVRDYIPNEIYFTPDTEYEDSAPDEDWKIPDPSTAERPKNAGTYDAKTGEYSVKWKIWEYNSKGKFEQREYGITALKGYTGLYCTSSTAESIRGKIYFKSGYGLSVRHIAETSITPVNKTPDSMYTPFQYSYMIWPEFGYSHEAGNISTLEKVDGAWQLHKFMNYGRVHWTPLWFPDGEYNAYACYSDIWTPQGMLTVTNGTGTLYVDGDCYDDWYIGHQ